MAIELLERDLREYKKAIKEAKNYAKHTAKRNSLLDKAEMAIRSAMMNRDKVFEEEKELSSQDFEKCCEVETIYYSLGF